MYSTRTSTQGIVGSDLQCDTAGMRIRTSTWRSLVFLGFVNERGGAGDQQTDWRRFSDADTVPVHRGEELSIKAKHSIYSIQPMSLP